MGVETVHEIRAAIARGEWRKPTSGVAAGFTQANVVILPKRYAFDFLLFCDRNPQPCPVIDVAEAGNPALLPEMVDHVARVVDAADIPVLADGDTGHGNVMPQSLHGGPGRAGGGEELGGLRALDFYHQRSAIQASTAVLSNL